MRSLARLRSAAPLARRLVAGRAPALQPLGAIARATIPFRSLSAVPSPAPEEPADSRPEPPSSAEPESHTPSWYKSEVSRAVRAKDYATAVMLFEAMTEAGIEPEPPTFNAFIEAVAVSRSVADARLTIDALLAKHPSLARETATFTALMRGCEAIADKQGGLQLLEEMKKAGLTPDRACFHTLISTLAAGRDFKQAEQVLVAMRKAGVQPTATSYFKIINAAFRNDEADVAYAVLSRMVEEWRTPDARAYERMLDQFTRLRHGEGQMRCLEGMIELQSTRNVSQQIGHMLRSELDNSKPDYSKVIALWNLAESREARLHWRLSSAVIHAHIQLDQHLDAFRVATRHAELGNRVMPRLADAIAIGLARDPAHVDEAYFLLERLQSTDQLVPLQAANIIIEACARIPDLDRAFATWAELSKLGLSPDIDTYNSLLATCVRAREYSSARRLLNRMETEGVVPNANTYALRAALHVLQQEFQVAMNVYQQCKDAELKPPVAMYHTLINMHLRRRPTPNAAAAGELLEDMKSTFARIHPTLEKNVAEAIAAVAEGRRYNPPSSRTRMLKEAEKNQMGEAVDERGSDRA